MKLKLLITIITINTFVSHSQQIGSGYAPYINDFSIPLLSGLYGGPNPNGKTPDNSADWQHLFTMRHGNPENNNQLQIASSFTINDRLFFRKISSALASQDTNWIELATRGSNSFTGNQFVNGAILSSISNDTGGHIQLINPTKNGGGIASTWMIYNMTGGYGNSLQFWAYDGLGCGGGLCANRFTIMDNGNVGIGIGGTTPYAQLTLNKVSGILGDPQNLILYNDNSNSVRYGFGVNGAAGGMDFCANQAAARTAFRWYGGADASTPNQLMALLGNGNLGIGTRDPQNKLDVNGTIHSKEVKVDMTGWSDFVFKKEYNLPTLEDVEKHIAEKGHLENIPSEEEVLNNGINLGEMNSKLLQKIEELTLYIIEQNKKTEELKTFISDQNKVISEQNTRIQKLENKP